MDLNEVIVNYMKNNSKTSIKVVINNAYGGFWVKPSQLEIINNLRSKDNLEPVKSSLYFDANRTDKYLIQVLEENTDIKTDLIVKEVEMYLPYQTWYIIEYDGYEQLGVKWKFPTDLS